MNKVENLFATAYLLLIFCVYPFYMPEGYVDIGETKHKFLIYCSMGGLGILLILGVIRKTQELWSRYRQREAYLIQWDQIRVSVIDLFVVLYGIEITISYVLSSYKQEALWGAEGWRIGLVLQLTLCGLYFAISRRWKASFSIWYGIMAASGIVFLLGILDRFSIYLIPLEIRDSGFISTLGNINWFCGYLSVISPIGACLFLFGKKPSERWLAGAYLIIAFMAGFAQGSSSVFLFFGALFFITLWIAVSKREWLSRWFFMGALWGFSSQLVWILRRLPGFYYNYETDNMCGYLTGSWLLAGVAVLSLLPGLILRRKRKLYSEKEKNSRMVRWLLILIPVVVALIWSILTFINTKWGISGLARWDQVFLFHDQWGNGRGATWKAGAAIFRQMNLTEKLLGVGSDCFAAFAYSKPQIAGVLRDNFGGSRLTNAHNELLTELVNAGIAGTIFYVGVFASSISRCFRKAREDNDLLIPAVCVFCYLVHNMVSFAQVLNFPFVLLLIAMGESMIRENSQ